MKPFLLLTLSLLLAIACTNQEAQETVNNPTPSLHLDIPNINVIPCNLPLQLDQINLNDDQNKVEISDQKAAFIEDIVKDYYYNECNGDPKQIYVKIKDTYVGTLWAVDTLTSVFYIILQQPSGVLDAKIAFYDNASNQPFPTIIDHDIQTMYRLKEGQFLSSNLKKEHSPHTPLIEPIDYNQDGINDFKISNLLHSGTKPYIKTQIFDVTTRQLEILNPEN